MLLRFRIANVLSFREETEVSLLARDTVEYARRTGIRQGGRELVALPLLALFGPNASGKTNLLAAMRWMSRAVTGKVDGWAPGEPIPRPLFVLDPTARGEASLFEAEFTIASERYVYGFELSEERVESEWLHVWPGTGRRRVLFERDPDKSDPFEYPSTWLKGDRKQLERLTRADALFLTVAATLNHPQLSPVYRWFADNLWLVSPGGDTAKRHRYTRDGFEADRQRFIQYLRLADLGIEDVIIDREHDRGGPRLTFLHRGRSGAVGLDLDRQESLGTHAWLAFLRPMFDAIDNGRVLLVDELDSSLHPTLVAEVLRVFRDPRANPRNAQLICNLHDASLLGTAHPERMLDKHEVWLCEKNRYGESEVYPLTDARPDSDTNLERGYLRGRFGGLPRINLGELADEAERRASEVDA